MKPKIVQNITLGLFLLLVITSTASCTEKQTKTFNAVDRSVSSLDQSCKPTDTISYQEYLRSFKTEQLGERKFVLRPNDTIQLEKPILKLFMSEIDGRKVQLWLSTHILGGYSSDLEICFEITSFASRDKFTRHALLTKDETSYSGKVSISDQIAYPIYFDPQNPSLLKIERNDGTMYELKESDLRFEACDRLVYKNMYCDQKSELLTDWAYFFNFRIAPSTAERLISNADLARSFEGFEGVDCNTQLVWKDTVRQETEPYPHLCDDPAFYYQRNYTQPLYIDSLLFVLTNYKDACMGGAHSITYTHYANFDLQTGKKLQLKDLLECDSQAFTAYYNKLVDRDFIEDNFIAEVVEDQIRPSSFFIMPHGICLQYAAYGLGGGFWEKQIFLPYEEIKPFLKTHKYFK